MNHLHDEVRVEAPIEHVWAFYCNTSHWQDWMPRVGHLEVNEPLDKVGTTYVATMRPNDPRGYWRTVVESS